MNYIRSIRIPVLLLFMLTLSVIHPGVALAEPAIALGGNDPLSYFDPSRETLQAGDAAFAVTHEGVEYHFVSSDNMTAFSMSPSEYAPAFGGLDPAGLADGSRTPGEPGLFSVIEGRLFLFQSVRSRERWLGQFDTLAPRAASNYGPGPVDTALDSALDRNTAKYQTRKNLGASGYDVVSYFPESGGKPVKGSKKHTIDYRGVTYRFADPGNLLRFVQQPSRYEPAYGGWCAYAIAKEGYTKPNPKRFLIQNERLLLFYDGILGDTYKAWNKEGPAQLELQADRWWEAESGESSGSGS